MCKPFVPPTHEEIQLAAYYLWLEMTTGSTEDNFVASTEGPDYFWFKAEAQLLKPEEESGTPS